MIGLQQEPRTFDDNARRFCCASTHGKIPLEGELNRSDMRGETGSCTTTRSGWTERSLEMTDRGRKSYLRWAILARGLRQGWIPEGNNSGKPRSHINLRDETAKPQSCRHTSRKRDPVPIWRPLIPGCGVIGRREFLIVHSRQCDEKITRLRIFNGLEIGKLHLGGIVFGIACIDTDQALANQLSGFSIYFPDHERKTGIVPVGILICDVTDPIQPTVPGRSNQAP